MLENAKWLKGQGIEGCPKFQKTFTVAGKVKSATLTATALGVYFAEMNGNRIGDFFLAPGWTVYRERVQVQEYDVTPLVREGENVFSITAAGGWYCGAIARNAAPAEKLPLVIASFTVTTENGESITVATDESFTVRESQTRFADIYHGEHFDADFTAVATAEPIPATVADTPDVKLIPMQGEKIVFHEKLKPVRYFVTPAGDRVLDFGQEITGIVAISVNAKKGDRIRLTCAEMLDKDGNFYTENYRSARSEMVYICKDGRQTWQPSLSFYGFRYIRVEGIEVNPDDYTAIVVFSDLTRTGFLNSGVKKLNRLFDNIIWGQKGNFVDVPTDCPQRDERLGWTGDAQVFCNTACWQFDTKKFFTKWLDDAKLEQRQSGAIPSVIPDVLNKAEQEVVKASTAWGETATVCPWQVYRHFGDLALLRSHFDMMKKWVGFITGVTDTPDLWTGYGKRQGHYGDWLGLDAPEGSYVGSSDRDMLASALYYYSTGLVIEAGHALGEDVSEYEALYGRIRDAYRATYTEYKTQTECVLTLYFGLAADAVSVTKKLVELIHAHGDCLTTGFVGTPYLLFALSQNGETDLAYTLLLQEKFPSWLYSVGQGATTIWEHWDGRKPDGSFWSRDMNSFNHYAYGAVAGWVFEEAAGITPVLPGFAKIRIAPKPDVRLGWLKAEHTVAAGKIVSSWTYEGDRVRYEIATPVPAVIVIDGREYEVEAGSYLF